MPDGRMNGFRVAAPPGRQIKNAAIRKNDSDDICIFPFSACSRADRKSGVRMEMTDRQGPGIIARSLPVFYIE